MRTGHVKIKFNEGHHHGMLEIYVTVKIYHSLQYIQQLFPLITQSYIATKFYAWSCVTCNKHTKFELDQVEAYRKMWLEVSTFWCSFDLETRLRSLKMVVGGGGGY